MQRFDRVALASELKDIPFVAQGSFAAAAAGRLLPAYLAYCDSTGHGDAKQLEAALGCAWSHFDVTLKPEHEARFQHDVAHALTAVPDTPANEFFACAENATAAVTYCLRFAMKYDVNDAVRAAFRSYDAAYQYSLQLVVEHQQVATKKDVDTWLSHPIVQSELMRQRRDIDELRSAESAQLGFTISRLRLRSAKESVVPLFS
jgi:uncharacterized protein YjaG (DUF416 family)